MPVSFGGKPAAPQAQPQQQPQAQPQQQPQQAAQAGTYAGAAPAQNYNPNANYNPNPGAPAAQAQPAKTGPAVNFLMHGQDAHAAFKQEQAKAEAAKAENGKLWRFYIPQNKVGVEHQLIFLDGELDANGMLKLVSWYEHTFMLQGRVQHFVCTGAHEPCPLCAGGSDRELMFAFTVIDLTPHTITKGPKEGQVIPWNRKLYVCKKKTAAQLQAMATKMQGLTGAQFSVVRSGNMAPNVGDTFFPIQRYSPEELVTEFGAEDGVPANYAEELTYRTADELVQLGVAEAIKTVDQSKFGGAGMSPGAGGSAGKGNFANQF